MDGGVHFCIVLYSGYSTMESMCASGAVAPELPGGCAGRAGRGRSVGPGAACSVLMYPASLDDYKGSDVTHILTGTSEIGHIHWEESIHSLE